MIYQLFNEFIDTFIIEKRDFLSGNNTIVLTQEALSEIIRVYVENQIEGTDMNFADKLKMQFEGASENSKIVFAHASWLFVLGSNSMTSKGKINAVQMSLFDIPNYTLRESIFLNKEGISDPGTAYNTSKPLSLKFLINLFNWLLMSNRKTTHQDVVDRIEAICLYGNYRKDSYLKDLFDSRTEDDIKTKFVMEVNKGGAPAKIIILNYLLNLCQPEKYERMASFRDKEAIAKKLFQKEYGSKEGMNIDDQIRVIKENLAKQNPDIDPTRLLYHYRIKPLWDSTGHASSPIHDTRMIEEQIEYSPTQTPGQQTNHPKNLILFGPPGTGKTYNTISKAVAIADSISEDELKRIYRSREELTNRYRQLVDEGRIVFTTFHQSMSYEDFIEGIKPVNRHDGSICYEVLPGIFKTLCVQSSKDDFRVVVMRPKVSIIRDSGIATISDQEFSKLYDTYLETLPDDSEDKRSRVILHTVRGNPFDVYRTKNRSSILVRAESKRTPSQISKNELLLVYRKRKSPNFISYEEILIDEILKLRVADPEPSIDNSFDQVYARLCSDLKSMPEPVMMVWTPNGAEFGISLNSNGNLTVHTAPEFKPSVTLTKQNVYSHALGENIPPYDKGYFLGVLRLLIDKYGFDDNTQNAFSEDRFSPDDFDTLYKLLIEEIRAKLSQSGKYLLHTKMGRPREVVNILSNNTLVVSSPDNRTYEIDVPALRKLFLTGRDPDTSSSKDIDEITGKWHSSAYRAIWSKIVQISESLQTKHSDDREINEGTSNTGGIEESKNDLTPPSTVLIIDEINRGNISQIFGELITLIEPDKRAGMPEALEAVLPYSKERFSVPSNLYIIGTMNTADRSVEALDTALRRRFSFREMAPEYDLLKGKQANGMDLGNLSETINKRIEALLDKDHAIGHSNFLRVTKGESTLEDVFFNEIIPLLQEYFYGNFGRIELVLGRGFVKSSQVTQSIFAKPTPDNDEFNDHVRYSLVRREEMDEDGFQEALRVLMT